MFIQKIHKKTKKKTYTSVYLVENYREKGKVKHRLISNLSKWSPKLISDFDNLLKGKNIASIDDLGLSNSKSFGAIKVVSQVAKRLGISQALGNSKEAKMALFQIAGRIINQGSRHYLANEWFKLQAVEEVFKLKEFTHNDLYKNLSWLSKKQDKIEDKVFKYRSKDQNIKSVYLYDVTSSYFEGDKNELAEFGYNRDKKLGKKQIVIGLLTDDSGYPVSVEVFKGNTSDPTTVSSQLSKLKDRFGVERVVFVGDKGMIKSTQIEEITSKQYKWNYLTTITKAQIKTLISKNVIQLDLFAEKVCEVNAEGGVRYILRKNPERAKALQENRELKIEKIKSFLKEKNAYLQEHPRASETVALRKVKEKITRLKLKDIVEVNCSNRILTIKINENAKEKASELDGCYVVKTDVPEPELGMQAAHDRYKDLSKVEFAFRTMKTTLEDIRPIYVRKEENTRGHVFVAMLAYMIVKYITEAVSELNFSRKYIFETLDKINYIQYQYEGETINTVPKKFTDDQQKILSALKITLK